MSRGVRHHRLGLTTARGSSLGRLSVRRSFCSVLRARSARGGVGDGLDADLLAAPSGLLSAPTLPGYPYTDRFGIGVLTLLHSRHTEPYGIC
ncbi:hypothetical protein U1Q18_033939 [Sarracenia purpurea var. burkii]